MNLALLGATGAIGGRVLDEALSRGHQVTGFSRDPAKLAPRPGLTAAAGRTQDVVPLAAAMSGHDAIIVAVKWTENRIEDVVDAVRRSRVKCSLFVVGAGSLRRADGRMHFDHMKDKGIETVTAVCAVQAGGVDRIQHDFKKNQFTPVPNYTTALARSILVEAVRPGTPTVAGSTNAGAAAVAAREPPPSGSRGSFRAAIKLRVR